MVTFSPCKKSCLTCSSLVTETKFTSAANGQSFNGIYDFEDGEPRILSCKSVNVIYLLECDNCRSQYVGETVQELKDRMSGHRGSTVQDKTTGNFRLRQHYACSNGTCSKFKVHIIQKLPGNGRTSEKQENSELFKIDPTITTIRKNHEDDWIMKLHTQYPYGCNDRIDSLKNKNLYNCEFAKFISPKIKRRRSWKSSCGGANNNSVDFDSIVSSLIDILLSSFSTSFINILKRILFPLSRKNLIIIRDRYLNRVFSDDELKFEVLRNHAHFIITDLLMYKIEPFNKVSNDVGNKKHKSKINFCILFVNKALDMINLPRIFRDKSLKSLVPFCKLKQPSVVYKYRPSISSKIFNYNATVNEFNDPDDITCMCGSHINFINSDLGHVATGDVSIFENESLRDTLRKGPKYIEPVTLNFEKAQEIILKNVDLLLDNWSNKEKIPKLCFRGWHQRFLELLSETIVDLKETYGQIRKAKSVFSDESVIMELEYFHKYFVICPIDKASKNVAIICKRLYLDTLLTECRTNVSSYSTVDISLNDILDKQKDFLKSNINAKVENLDMMLPHIILFPKFHKPVFSQRFIVSYASCMIKPLARLLTKGLKAIYNQICSYSNMIFKVTGINRNWIIKNNEPLLECLNSYLNSERARNIQTFDFTTLYTSLKHDEIKEALKSVVKLAFKHSKRKFIAIYNSSFAWVNKTKENTFRFDEKSLLESIDFLMDNCYFTLGDMIFKQIIGVPMGVDPGPYIANLTLWFYENKYLERLYKLDYFCAKRLNNSFRLIDDITSINSDGIFHSHAQNIYPSSLILNKENESDFSANVLDLNIKVKDCKFEIELYDKRENFPFDIVQYIDKASNVSRITYFGVFISQVIRYYRICNNLTSFKKRIELIVKYFVSKLEIDIKHLKQRYENIKRRHKFIKKFKDIESISSIFG